MQTLFVILALLVGLALGILLARRQSLRLEPYDMEKAAAKWQETNEKQRHKAERNHCN